MLPKKKYLRSNQCQLRMLVDYMFLHQNFAKGEYSGPVGSENYRKEWEALRGLLRLHGADKSTEQWRHTWRDLKKRARDEANKFRMATRAGNVSPDAALSEMTFKVLSIIGEEPSETSLSLEPSEPKPKKPKNTVFFTVKQACVDLVKKHGLLVSLFDDEAFRSILQLLPMTSKEKAKITSEYIQKYVDLTGDEDETAMSMQDDQEASDNEDETYIVPIVTIKSEAADEPECSCNSDARGSDDSTPAHDLGCPAAARQPYWNYFEVSTDEAICQVCGETIAWSNITTLKEHLVEKHPTAEFVDDETEFARGPGSDVWSHDDSGEVDPEEDLYGDPPPATPAPGYRKRKRPTRQHKSSDNGTACPRESGDEKPSRSREKTMKEMRVEIEGLSQASRKMIEMAPERFRCLDTFGMYVAELMKLIPRDKCLKFQVKIVQRLLQEQAAAG